MAQPNKNLELALQSIQKQFGEGSIVRLTDTTTLSVEALSLDVIGIDRALGIGGLPRGRIVEIFGPESSGKTTFCLTAIARAQQTGGVAAFIDVEHALDPVYAKKLGVNLNDLLVSQPNSGEEALDIAEILIKSGSVDIVVVDSVAALVTKKELEGEMGDVTMGAQARLMSQAMRKLTSFISKSNTIALFTNQIREKIGVMFGSPETTPGGKALKFYASVRIDIRRIAAIKTPDGTVLGNRTRIKIVKNKVAPPFRESEFDIFFGSGIGKESNLLEEAITEGILTKKGAWIYYGDLSVGQGQAAAVENLKGNPTLFADILKALKAKINDIVTPEPISGEEPEEMPESELVDPPTPVVTKKESKNSIEPVVATVPVDAPLAPEAKYVTPVAAPTTVPELPVQEETTVVEAQSEVKPETQSEGKVSVPQSILKYLETVPNKQSSIKEIVENLAPLFPDRPIDALKNQISVSLSTGSKVGKYTNPARGIYGLPS